MAAYIVFLRNSISDAEGMKTYTGLARKAVAAGGPKVLAAYNGTETLEGQECEGVVLMEFESMDAAKAWYNGPGYQEALPHRFRSADYRTVMFQGV